MPEIEEAVLERTTYRKPGRFTVRIDNDDSTPMEFVVLLIQNVFGIPEEEAFAAMLKVHHEGCVRIGEYTREVAEMKVGKLVGISRDNGFPLNSVPEQIG